MKTIDIRVNKELIMKYDPCLDGLDNFNRHYIDISIKELINSKKISYEHKLWLLKKIVPQDLMVLWAIDSAFAAYEYSNISSNYAANAAVYAANSANAAANAANAANDAVYASNAAVNAAYFAGPYISVSAYYKAKNERLQSLLYLIENEG